MVSTENLLSQPYWKIPFTVHTDASDKHLGAVIIQNNKPIELFSRGIIKPQRKYTIIEKEVLSVVECLNQLPGILFRYEINVFLYNKNLVYATTLSESQRVMHWGLIIEYFGLNIKHSWILQNSS